MKKAIYGLLLMSIIAVLTACGSEKNVQNVENIESTVGTEVVETEDVETEEPETSSETETSYEEWMGEYVHKNGAGIKINSDGTFATYKDFENGKGKEIGTYEKDGEQWIFHSPIWENDSVTGVYDGKCWNFDGELYESTFSGRMEGLIRPLYNLTVKDSHIFIMGETVSGLRESGFSINADYENITVMPGELMEMDISYDNAIAEIKVINPYEKEVMLSDCRVCSFFTEDTTGVYKVDDKSCGEENRDALLTYDVYEYTDSKLVYKKSVLPAIVISITNREIIDITGNADITFNFEGMTLKSFKYELTDVIYDGLSANVNSESMKDMNLSKIHTIINLRDNILKEIQIAFNDAGVDIDMNQKTGEINMNNNILFDTDSYELSVEGKNYVEQFMNVYLSVLMSEQFAGRIEEVKFEGHTDSSGEFGYNQVLSQKRAEAVKTYCLDNLGDIFTESEKEMLQQLTTAQGYSSANLVYDEDGNEDADASRRVAVKFLINVE